MSDVLPVAGWYNDPELAEGLRYWDGGQWTQYRSGDYNPAVFQSWKGIKHGLPQEGSGSLTSPGKRLGARALDGLVLTPVLIVFTIIAVILILPHAGPLLPDNSCDDMTANECSDSSHQPTPGIVWLYFGFWGAAILTQFVAFFYEAIMTAKFGRSLGKKWMGIRPVRTNGEPLGWGRSFGRTAVYFASTCIPYLGYLDPCWCLWDGASQTLHDKAARTFVIND